MITPGFATATLTFVAVFVLRVDVKARRGPSQLDRVTCLTNVLSEKTKIDTQLMRTHSVHAWLQHLWL